MASLNNWAWKSGLKFGFNIERTGEVNLPFDESAIASAAAAGCTHIRDFIPFNTELNFGLAGWPAVPSDATINTFLDGCERVMAAGMKSHLDCTDVLNPGDWTGAGLQTITTHVGNVARLASARGFDKTKFLIGSTNEWAGSTDATTAAARASLALAIQAVMGTDQPIAINGANWDYNAQEIEADFVIPAGLMCPVVQTHDYDTDTGAQWNTLAAALAALETHLGCPVYLGEVGLGGQSGTYNQNVYEGTLQSLMGAMGEYAPTIWALTTGSADRLNNSATDGTLMPTMASVIAWANSQMKGATVPVTLPTAAPTPAPTVTGGTGSTASSGSSSPTVASGTGGSTVAGSTGGTTVAGGASGEPVAQPAPADPAPAAPAPTTAAQLSASVAVTAAGLEVTVTKATGSTNTIRIAFGSVHDVLQDLAPDRTHTYTVALPAPGSYSGEVTLDGSSATAPVAFTVPEPATTAPAAPAPAAASTSAPTDADILTALGTATAAQLAGVRTALGIA